MTYSSLALVNPRVTKQPFDLKEFERNHFYFKKAMDDIERRLGEHPYLCGPEKTIADLSAACELDQTKWVNYDFEGYPRAKEWHERMID